MSERTKCIVVWRSVLGLEWMLLFNYRGINLPGDLYRNSLGKQ